MRAFQRCFDMELCKAVVKNPWFWGSLLVGLALAGMTAFQSYEMMRSGLAEALAQWDTVNELYSALSCYTYWMPMHGSSLFFAGLFYLVWPLLAALPYAWSWTQEAKSGLCEQVSVRVGWGTAYVTKSFAAFCSGGLVICLPLLVNLVACACFAPAAMPRVEDMLATGMWANAPLSDLYYTTPLLFCLVWLLVSFVAAGLWSVLVMSVSAYVDNFIASFAGMYLLLHLLAYVGSSIQLLVASADGRGSTVAIWLNVLQVLIPGTGDLTSVMFMVAYGGMVVAIAFAVCRETLRGECP